MSINILYIVHLLLLLPLPLLLMYRVCMDIVYMPRVTIYRLYADL